MICAELFQTLTDIKAGDGRAVREWTGLFVASATGREATPIDSGHTPGLHQPQHAVTNTFSAAQGIRSMRVSLQAEVAPTNV